MSSMIFAPFQCMVVMEVPACCFFLCQIFTVLSGIVQLCYWWTALLCVAQWVNFVSFYSCETVQNWPIVWIDWLSANCVSQMEI